MADELSLSQTAYLCAIPNSPTYYNPYRHPENALTRRDKILEDMLKYGIYYGESVQRGKGGGDHGQPPESAAAQL